MTKITEDNNPKGYELDEEGLIDTRKLSNAQQKAMRDCYQEMLKSLNNTLTKYYQHDPLSPLMFNQMFGPIYTTLLETLVSTFPEHVRLSTKHHTADHLNGLIHHIIAEVAKEETDEEEVNLK